MTERSTTYRAGLVSEQGDYKLFLPRDDDQAIRDYLRDRYGATDIEIVHTGGGKLAGPIGEGDIKEEGL